MSKICDKLLGVELDNGAFRIPTNVIIAVTLVLRKGEGEKYIDTSTNSNFVNHLVVSSAL